MARHFNTAGPVVIEDHYTIDPLTRLDWEEIQELFNNKKYFILHAPRQTGKTSTLLAIMKKINSESNYVALYVNIEAAQASRNDANSAITVICNTLVTSAKVYLQDTHLEKEWNKIKNQQESKSSLFDLLTYWATTSSKPVILMLDEVDALVGDSLISLLRQIRAGYAQRPAAFPQSIVLCGVRDVKDYRIQSSNQEIITGGSAFNIKTESLRMGNFIEQEVKTLILQHTNETGQTFETSILDCIWEDTQGQPWLVNALAYQLTWKNKELRDRSKPITLSHYLTAREQLIQSRATHLDQLADKLKEDRVKQVILPILEGEENTVTVNPHDVQYVVDLGLISQSRNGKLQIANKIYQEVIPRELSWGSQLSLTTESQAFYIKENNYLNMPILLQGFQQFFREHSDAWLKDLPYKEVAPQLLLQAFLQRIINGGGRINREYALGRKRMDLLIEWPIEPDKGWFGTIHRIVVEIKILRASLAKTLPLSLEQTYQYAQQVGASEAHLIVFDRSTKVSWNKKIWHKTKTHEGMTIEVWGA